MSYPDCTEVDFSDLKGKTIVHVTNRGDEQLIFCTLEGDVYIQRHEQDCCETVQIEEVIGDLNDIIGSPLLTAEERSESDEDKFGFRTWTFYELATIKGSVTIRWLGESSGYYSESVTTYRVQLI